MKNLRKNSFFRFLVEDILKKGILRVLSDKQFIALEYFIYAKKILNLKNPETFSDKLQWIKIYGKLERFKEYVDKFAVREFISQIVGKKYLVPILGVWNNFEKIPFDKFPNKFVLKATHGSGYVYICKDKSKINIPELKLIVDNWLNENYYLKSRESQYKFCVPKIIAETYLEDDRAEPATDYKIFCSNGLPKLIEVVWDRFTDNKGDVYKDLNWKTLDIGYIGFPYSKKRLIKPEKLNEMLELSKKLSKFAPFVRVDMYVFKNKIYVGELTLTPASGLEKFDPLKADYYLGKLINISKYASNLLTV